MLISLPTSEKFDANHNDVRSSKLPTMRIDVNDTSHLDEYNGCSLIS